MRIRRVEGEQHRQFAGGVKAAGPDLCQTCRWQDHVGGTEYPIGAAGCPARGCQDQVRADKHRRREARLAEHLRTRRELGGVCRYIRCCGGVYLTCGETSLVVFLGTTALPPHPGRSLPAALRLCFSASLLVT